VSGRPKSRPEQKATEFALELVAPEQEVATLLRSFIQSDAPHADALEHAIRLVSEKYDLPADEAAARARAGLEILGRTPKFFER
jgi:hypothetical protein